MSTTPPLEPWNDPAAEARVVAWIMGEASDFEAAEVRRMLSESPELAAFARRLRAVHELLGEAATPEPADSSWKLSNERRHVLEGEIGALDRRATAPQDGTAEEAGDADGEAGVADAPEKAGGGGSRFWWLAAWPGRLSAVAAALVVGAVSIFLLSEGWRETRSIGTMVDTSDYDGRMVDLELDLPRELSVGTPVDLSHVLERHERERQAALAERGRGSGLAQRDGSGPPLVGRFMRGEDAGSGDVAASQPRSRPQPPPQAQPTITGGARELAGGGIGGLADEPLPVAAAASDERRAGMDVARADVPMGRAAAPPTPALATAFESSGSMDPFSASGLEGDQVGDVDSDALRQAAALAAMEADSPEQERHRAAAELLAEPMSKAAADDGGVAAPADLEPLEDENAAVNPVSTFSLFVSDASFRQAATALIDQGRLPDPETVRTEDFVNTFDYGDPSPGPGEPVAMVVEQVAHPFVPGRNLVRLGVRTASGGRADGQPLNLTVVLDASGSMERPDRAEAVGQALDELAGLLRDEDRVNLITFARQARLAGEQLRGEQARRALRALRESAPPEGGTHMEAALQLTRQIAVRGFDPAAMNRVVLITDGAANLGDTDPEVLGEKIGALREAGIAFDACGVGTTGLDDAILEALSRRGDGRYVVLDASAPGSAARFARDLAGAFRPAARNVKVQVRFNPERVRGYRLLGFERHRLAEEDFHDDSVAAADLAAAAQGNAVYQIELLPEGRGEAGEVAVRFYDVASGQMVERLWTIPWEPSAPAFDRAAAPTRKAATAALFAEWLRGSTVGRMVTLDTLHQQGGALRHDFPENPDVDVLARMLDNASRF